MSSLARRSLSTTAAAAGIAAVGVGFAGHAFAAPAPALPAVPDTGALGAAPAAPDAGSAPNLLGGGQPAAPTGGLGDLPMIFTFESPKVYTGMADTAGTPGFSTVPALPESDVAGLPTDGLPAVPLAGPTAPEPGTENVSEAGQFSNNEVDSTTLPAEVADSALPSLDDAATLTDLTGRR